MTMPRYGKWARGPSAAPNTGSLLFLTDVRRMSYLLNCLSYPHVLCIISCSFYAYQNYCIFLVLHFLEANMSFPTLSRYIHSLLHTALSFHAATRAVLALFLISGGIQEVKTSAPAVTSYIQIDACKVNSDNGKQLLFWTKPKTAKKLGKVQKGHSR